MCANGAIKAAVKQRYGGEDIEGVLFCNRPVNFRRVAGGVAEGAEYAFDKADKAVVLVDFAWGGE